jgi:hypothetical protein
LLDGCTCHFSAKITEEAEKNGIIIKLIPPHSSDQCQALDVSMLGLFKNRKMRTRLSIPNLDKQSEEIIKTLTAWQTVATPMNITKTFDRVGIKKMLNGGNIEIVIDRSHTVKVRHWQDDTKEVSEGDEEEPFK